MTKQFDTHKAGQTFSDFQSIKQNETQNLLLLLVK